MKKLITLSVILLLASCTEQARTRKLGGKTEIKLPKGERLLNATWKDSNIFYLTEPYDSNYKPKKKIFRESSSFGIYQSEVLFIEE